MATVVIELLKSLLIPVVQFDTFLIEPRLVSMGYNAFVSMDSAVDTPDDIFEIKNNSSMLFFFIPAY